MRNVLFLIIALGALFVIGTKATFIVADHVQRARGFRNNNPGNVRRGQSWIGMRATQTDPSFDQFIAPEFGIRAIKILLRNYQRNYGLQTLRQIISRYAPGHENPTDAYVDNAASEADVHPDAPIAIDQYMPQVVSAIIKQEIGGQPYPNDVLIRGLVLADNGSQAAFAASNPSTLPSFRIGLVS